MYEDLNCFEEALKHFGTRVELTIALEMGRKLSAEDAYKTIKEELRVLKECRKQFKKNKDC